VMQSKVMQSEVECAKVRPSGYNYLEIMRNHLGGDLTQVFNGKLVYPRQLEIHLPGDGVRPCNFNCYWCQGRLLEQPLGKFEEAALELVSKLNGCIPFHIYGGAYTEPLLNTYLLDFLKLTKSTGANFGIHTNGSLLLGLELENGFLSELCRISTSPEDYLSISLDAGNTLSHTLGKGLKKDWFNNIITGIKEAKMIRGNSHSPAIRVCYLLNKHNSGPDEIRAIVRIMKRIGVDSLRFSIPYDNYGKSFERVRRYKETVEVKGARSLYSVIEPYLSKSPDERPFIFYIGPECQDVEKMNFRQCIYTYYQITFGADGYVYKCSSAASPTFAVCRLGLIPDTLESFNSMVLANHNPDFNANICFNIGARCNRMALEINRKWADITGNV